MTDIFRQTDRPLRWLAADIEMEAEYPSHFASLVPILRAADALIEAVEYPEEWDVDDARLQYAAAVKAWKGR